MRPECSLANNPQRLTPPIITTSRPLMFPALNKFQTTKMAGDAARLRDCETGNPPHIARLSYSFFISLNAPAEGPSQKRLRANLKVSVPVFHPLDKCG